ncbi:phosphoglycerate dehydrogenase, partial [Candidatus Woesearchaeota archaeon]
MKPPFFLIIDFDSTVIQVEALDELAEISLENYPDKNQRKEQIRLLTNLGMEGKLEFPESLKQRICLLNAHRDDLKQLIRRLHKKISVSFIRNIDFFRNHADSIYIVSGGFREFICPIIQELGLKPENVYANNFVFDNAGNIIGFDKKNIMGQKDGKVALLKMLNLDTDIYVIGDGYTDYQIKSAGLANKFFAFTENIHRDNVVQ